MKKKLNYFLRLACIYSFFLIISTALFIALFWIKFFDFLDILFFKSLVLIAMITENKVNKTSFKNPLVSSIRKSTSNFLMKEEACIALDNRLFSGSS
jgi:hypothetical protein